jgi:hypothetical protein
MATDRKELARTAQTTDPQDGNSGIRVQFIRDCEFGLGPQGPYPGEVKILSASVARAVIRDGFADPV